jgi:ribonuclease HI
MEAPMSEREERFEEALRSLLRWSKIYSRDVFPEPDWEKADELLKAGGISLDVIRLHCMRHIMERVGQIAREALDEPASGP